MCDCSDCEIAKYLPKMLLLFHEFRSDMFFNRLHLRYFRQSLLKLNNMSTSINSRKIIYSKRGNPRNLLQLVEEQLDSGSIRGEQVLVGVLATPINPSDINQIEGTYLHLPETPATPGNEFVGEVLKTGEDVTALAPGDHVIAASPGLGTWRSHLITSQDMLQKVSKSLPINFAATLLVNPCTAYRMLQDFVPLQVGDTLIQNAANSAVGQMVIQLAKYKGIKTVNIIRERTDFSDVKKFLEDLGASVVLSDKQLRLPADRDSVVKRFGRAKLALNAVGGKRVNDMSSYLKDGGTVVTYGAMSREPNVLPAGKLIFMDHRHVGYWNTRWLEENGGSVECRRMIDGISRMVVDGRVVGPQMEAFKLESYKEAVERYFTPYTNKKQIFVL